VGVAVSLTGMKTTSHFITTQLPGVISMTCNASNKSAHPVSMTNTSEFVSILGDDSVG
jgi:hypothetical protein